MHEMLEWERHNGKFTAEKFDPETGIQTSWEKDIRAKSTTIRNAFPAGYPLRVIYEVNNPERNHIKKSYSIYNKQEGVGQQHGSLNIEGGKQELQIGLNTTEEPDAYFQLEAYYSEQGRLESFSTNLVSKKATEDEMSDTLFGKMRYFNQRSPDENLREVVNLFKYHGKRVFFPSESGDELDLEEAKKVSLSLLQNEFEQKGWTEEELDQIIENMTVSADNFVDGLIQDDLTDEQKGEVVEQLTLKALENFVDFTKESLDKQPTVYSAAIKKALEWNLAWYYEELDSISATFAHFTRSNEKSDQFKITMKDMQNNTLDTQDLPYDQQYSYASEQYYMLDKTEKGTLRLQVGSALPSIQPREIEFPTNVDIQQYQTLVSTEENIGWERAFTLFSIGYKLNQK